MKNILVIEEDSGIAECIKQCLELEGFKVHTVKNCSKGYEHLQKMGSMPCMVLVDIFHTGGADDLLTCMRSIDKMVAIPVVAMSATTRVEAPEGISLIKKPFGLDALIDVVRCYC